MSADREHAHQAATPSDEGGDPACWAHLFEGDVDDHVDGTVDRPAPGVTVLQLSDTHLRRTPGELVSGHDPDARLAAVLEQWRQTGWSADLVVLTGDNADDGSVEAYRRVQAALAPLGAPVLALVGNHDDAANQRSVFGDATVADVGGWRVVGISSAVPNQVHGTVDAALAAQQLDGADRRPTVAAIHHPPVSRGGHEWFRLDGADDLLAVLAERSHVRLLVSGHVHDVFEMAGPESLTLLGCPSSLVAIAHDGETFEIGADAPTGARVLHLADDGSYSSTLLET
jgi:3',5'-cyclic-AMP phosphodiesterase